MKEETNEVTVAEQDVACHGQASLEPQESQSATAAQCGQDSPSQAEACSTSMDSPQSPSQAEACSTSPETVESQETSQEEEQGPDMEALLAEAEQKGYLRGRNERIEELMREPAPYARQSAPQSPVSTIPEESSRSEPMILNNPRISIWDR